jgi:hypothetical protein
VIKRMMNCELVRLMFDVEILNLKKLDDMEVREMYVVKMSNRFSAFGSIYNMDINTAWESIKEKNTQLKTVQVITS